MKCSSCGAELHGKNTCSSCGKKIEMSKEDLEIEYKEFKLSEFLEIRKKRGASEDDISISTYGDKLSHEIVERSRLTDRETKGTIQQTEKKGRKLFTATILIFIGTALIIGAYFLLRFVFRP